jgi:uncharacterized RDD family membrane protein YckC
MKTAGMAARATAAIIDGLFTFIVLGEGVAIAAGQNHNANGNVGFSLHGGPALIWLVLAIGYWVVCERLWGMTIGKRLFSIRVEGPGGGRPTWGASVLRNLFRLVDGFPYVLPYLVGFIVAKTDGERRRIGDRIAGTRVVG